MCNIFSQNLPVG